MGRANHARLPVSASRCRNGHVNVNSCEVQRQPVRVVESFLKVCTVQTGASVVSRVAIMVFHRLLCVARASKDSHATTGCPYCWQTLMSFMLALTTTDTTLSCETISSTPRHRCAATTYAWRCLALQKSPRLTVCTMRVGTEIEKCQCSERSTERRRSAMYGTRTEG